MARRGRRGRRRRARLAVAVELFGHAHPLFAAVTAIVCLAPGLPDHGRQAVGLILGVTTGIVVGEIAVQFPDTYPLLRVSLTAFVAILVASAYGLAPVVPIQAGVSAILVLALGPATAGAVRFLDVAAGTATGLLFSQVLLTPDPVRLLDDAAADLVARLRSAFRGAAAALGSGDQARAQAAVETFSSAHASLAALTGAIDTARSAARWSLRGRLAARRGCRSSTCTTAVPPASTRPPSSSAPRSRAQWRAVRRRRPRCCRACATSSA